MEDSIDKSVINKESQHRKQKVIINSKITNNTDNVNNGAKVFN